jgi:NAD(P)H-flavin reductase
MRLVSIRRETADTVTLQLDAAGRGGFRFLPGQFNMLAAFGIGEVPISISGNPRKAARLIHTVRAVGAVTRALTRLRRGGVVGVRGPFGTSWPLHAARGKDVVLVTGGIGLAPLKPAIDYLVDHRRQFGRVGIAIGARSPLDLPFRTEIAQWRRKLDVELEVTVDRGEGDWRGHVGVVTKLLPQLDFEPKKAIAMLCGPEIMMRFAARELERLGMQLADIFVSLERNMRCGIGHCGHCQLGPLLLCRDGPVVSYERAAPLLAVREL